MKRPLAFFTCGAALAALQATADIGAAAPQGAVAVKDEKTAEIVLQNDRVRLRFHPGKPRFGLFPKGYTGYTLDLRAGDHWIPMAEVEYFTSYSYRSGWGRDWLHYVVPEDARITQQADRASVVFTQHQTDLDRVAWTFTFSFSLEAGKNVVDVVYSASVAESRELLLFNGPRLHVGEGSFGAAKDEALFPGLEYLAADERSSQMRALAPDTRLNFAPHPAKITIPLMAVVKDGAMAGLLWNPLQKWNGSAMYPSALFASPNWIEGEANHLLGLFLPSIPDYVAENGLKAHIPLVIGAGKAVTLECKLFAAPARRVVEAVDLYLRETGGLPEVAPRAGSEDALLEMLVRVLATSAWDPAQKGWRYLYGDAASMDPLTVLCLDRALPLLKDESLALQVREVLIGTQEAAPPVLQLALRFGKVEKGLLAEKEAAERELRRQQPDGSWFYEPSQIGEGGLAGLMGPPRPGAIGCAGDRSQGITAGHVAQVMRYALVSGNEEMLRAGLRGIEDMNRSTIPFTYAQDECPQSPSLHGSYYASRSCLDAYLITGDKKQLERAAYWAKTGLPFIYLWAQPSREVQSGQVHTADKTVPAGNALYRDTRRAPMLYGALYGYGSSQFMHHWYGLLVHWIGLVYSMDLERLARHDNTLDWKKIAAGIRNSGAWQTFDQPPFAGYFPDAFSVETWMPSGPAFSPRLLLSALLEGHYGRPMEPRTIVLSNGGRRHHVTSLARIEAAAITERGLAFAVSDPAGDLARIIISGLGEDARVSVDGQPLAKAPHLEAENECWAAGPDGTALVKVKLNGSPRRVEISPQGKLHRKIE